MCVVGLAEETGREKKKNRKGKINQSERSWAGRGGGRGIGRKSGENTKDLNIRDGRKGEAAPSTKGEAPALAGYEGKQSGEGDWLGKETSRKIGVAGVEEDRRITAETPGDKKRNEEKSPC